MISEAHFVCRFNGRNKTIESCLYNMTMTMCLFYISIIRKELYNNMTMYGELETTDL